MESLVAEHPVVQAKVPQKKNKVHDWYQEAMDAQNDDQKELDLTRWRNSPEYDVNRDTEYWDKIKKADEELKKQNIWDDEDLGAKIVDEVEDIEKEFLDDYKVDGIEKEIKSINKKFKWDKLVKLFIVSRWIINTIFIGIPWLFWSFLMVLYNIVFNAWINNWWAKGNIWLLVNTYFSIFQALASLPLFFEFGIYLRHFYAIRWFSLFSAIKYNVVFDC